MLVSVVVCDFPFFSIWLSVFRQNTKQFSKFLYPMWFSIFSYSVSGSLERACFHVETATSKRENWRENRDHVVIFAVRVSGMCDAKSMMIAARFQSNLPRPSSQNSRFVEKDFCQFSKFKQRLEDNNNNNNN